MKKHIGLSVIIMFFCAASYAQQGSGTENNKTAPGQVSDSTQAAGAEQTQPGATVSGDTTNSAQAASGDTAAAPNAAVIQQATSSGSGSPAVLSPDNGKDRDGTNNVQRASMNMVGSPAGNIQLSEEKAVDADTEMADRQEQTQEKQVSAQGDNGKSSADGVSEENRAKNNTGSDENLSAKEKEARQAEKNKVDKKLKDKKDKSKG